MDKKRLFLAAAACLGLVCTAPVWGQVNGAIFTTTSTGTTVNGNIYNNKSDVYLTGGPQNNHDPGLSPDGDYYFQVTDPGGATLLSSDPIACREVHVTGGRIVSIVAAGGCQHAPGTA